MADSEITTLIRKLDSAMFHLPDHGRTAEEKLRELREMMLGMKQGAENVPPR